MNRDFDFYGKIIKQEHPNDLNTIVNKYYQLDETYEPSWSCWNKYKTQVLMEVLIVNILLEKWFMMIFKL